MADGTSVHHVEKLDGSNYPSWRFKMTILLKAKGLWSTVEGHPPQEAEARRQWDKQDLEAVNSIVQTLSSAQTSYIINQTSANAIWNKLEQVNRGKVLEKKMALKRELNGLQWKKEETAGQYMHRLESLGEQLRSLGDSLEDPELAAIAIQGLPRSYYGVARSFDVCSMSDITPDKVKYALLQEEQRQKKDSADEAACRANAQHGQHKDEGKFIKCYNCGKPGHIARNCWSRPSGSSQKFSSRQPGKGEGFRPTKKPPKHGVRLVRSTENHVEDPPPREFAFGLSDGDNPRPRYQDWSIDSGATSHMTGCREILRDFKEEDGRTVTVADGKTIVAQGSGTVIFHVCDGNVDNTLKAKDVLYVPGLVENLISVPKLTDSGFEVSFMGNDCCVFRKGEFIFAGAKINGVYKMKADVAHVSERADHVRSGEMILWHRRMGHLNMGTLTRMAEEHTVAGLPAFQRGTATCEDCILGKHCREPFNPSDRRDNTQVLDLLHIDLCGPFSVDSIGGSRYLLVVVDDCSRHATVYFLKQKNEVTGTLKYHIQTAETQTGIHVKRIRTDNGGEFINEGLGTYLRQKGIIHERTAPYSPAQNGVAERMNRTLVEAARTLLSEAQLPLPFWGEAVNTAAYVRNRCCNRTIRDKVPEEVYSRRYQTVRFFKVFGCLAYAWIPQRQRTKMEPKSKPVIFVGYSQHRKAYRLYDPVSNQIVVSRDVKFFEDKLGATLLTDTAQQENGSTDLRYVWVQAGSCTTSQSLLDYQSDTPSLKDAESQDLPTQEQPDTEPYMELDISDETTEVSCSDSLTESDPPNHSEFSSEERRENAPLRRSARVTKPPSRLQLDPSKRSYCDIALEDPKDPKSYGEAIASPQRDKWKEAMNEELTSLHKMKTWTLVPRESGMKVIKSKWVYRIKRDAAGNIDKYKARLVAVGSSQVEGLDYFETFSPVVKLTSLRTLLALGLQQGLVMRQLDVKTAYLHGTLEETVYMEPPAGSTCTDGKVCRLNKALYGLKQSGRTWYLTLDNILRQQGYKRLEADRCVYVLQRGTGKVILSVYVDDMLLLATSTQLLSTAIKNLGQEVDLKDLGEPAYILGIEVCHNKEQNTLTVSQKKYVDEVLKRFGMQDCKPAKTPMETAGWKEESQSTQREKPNVPYQTLIGSLMYLVQGTRPDIAFAVNYLSQFSHQYTDKHWKLAKRVLRYLQGTREVGITYRQSDDPILGHTDASWNEFGTGKSRSAYVFTMCQAAISWKSTKQHLVALSTCEAEYISLAETMKEGRWFQTFFVELGFDNYGTVPLEVRCDNQSAIKIVENPIHHQRTKHIELKYLFARNEVEAKRFKVTYQRSEEMIADALTKPVPRWKIRVCAEGFGFTNFS